MSILRIRGIVPAVGFQRLFVFLVYNQLVGSGERPGFQIKERQIANRLFIQPVAVAAGDHMALFVIGIDAPGKTAVRIGEPEQGRGINR
ncbi:hypothetical protein D3C79_1019290 [compost metagenome]